MMLEEWRKKLIESEGKPLSSVLTSAKFTSPIPPGIRARIIPAGGRAQAFNLRDIISGIISPEAALPLMQWGDATGSDVGQWYQVVFPTKYSALPRVVASALYQSGQQPSQTYTPPQLTAPTFVAPTFVAPTFNPPSVTAPSLSITLPTWESARDWRTDLRSRIRNLYKKLMAWMGRGLHDGMSDKGPSWWKSIFNGPGNVCQGAVYGPEGMDFDTHVTLNFDSYGNPIENPSSTSAYTRTANRMDELGDAIAGGLETIVNTIIPSDFTKFRDNAQGAINAGLGTYKANIDSMMSGYNTQLKDAMKSYTDGLTTRMNDYTSRLTTQMNTFSSNLTNALNQVTALAQKSINESINQLYAFIGLPKDTKASIVEIRAITQDGFQFLSQGNSEIHWFAIGES